MKLLEDRIRKDGIIREGNVLKVDSFINHQMDIGLFEEMAKDWKRLFADKKINKILTKPKFFQKKDSWFSPTASLLLLFLFFFFIILRVCAFCFFFRFS